MGKQGDGEEEQATEDELRGIGIESAAFQQTEQGLAQDEQGGHRRQAGYDEHAQGAGK